MRIVHKTCENCGAKYSYMASAYGMSPSEWNKKKGVTGKYCAKCAPEHHIPAKPWDWKWIPTDEVTSEQMFEWDKECRAEQKRKEEESRARLKESNSWKDFYLPVRRVYLGLVKNDLSDVQDAIWARGYQMVYWRNSREVVSIRKKAKKE